MMIAEAFDLFADELHQKATRIRKDFFENSELKADIIDEIADAAWQVSVRFSQAEQSSASGSPASTPLKDIPDA